MRRAIAASSCLTRRLWRDRRCTRRSCWPDRDGGAEPPFLPLPDRDYLRFRMETAYGGAGDQQPKPADLLTYLRWCRDFPA